ncbi:uncharacterized protein LOC144643094 [Oculina patagonica]
MTLFLVVVAIVTCIAGVDSATNVTTVTSCTSLINDQCQQNLTSCPQSPCSLSCGRTSPQFSCSQDCIPSANLTEGYLCDALECQPSQFCYQTCSRINCNSSTCTSKDCNQQCWVADCGRMVCKENVTNCNQVAVIPKNGQVMDCDAKACNQECKSSGKSFTSDLTCSSSVETCEQRGLTGKFNLKCLPGVKNCTQKADLFSIANMECDGDRCEQSCFHSTCNMNCSSSVRECTQSEDGFGSAVINMNCDADVCRQDCGDSRCTMTCSSTVKECTQTCKGTCVIKCDAEVCNDGTTSTPTTAARPPIPTNSISKIGVNIVTICLVVMSSVTSTW